MNNHVHRAPFSDIERKKEVAKSKMYMNNHVYRNTSDIERKKEIAKSKERRKKNHNFIKLLNMYMYNVHVHVGVNVIYASLNTSIQFSYKSPLCS